MNSIYSQNGRVDTYIVNASGGMSEKKKVCDAAMRRRLKVAILISPK